MEHPENSGEYKGLVVNKGIEQHSSVNPYLKRNPKKGQLSVAEFVEGLSLIHILPGQQYEVAALDAQTGHPVPNAKIILYSNCLLYTSVY